ncbi:S-layer homology domain-containing protein [Paenibacillus sp. KQZ6P-2]|uniref:S-layer homology domain-containing protein n=1 Tax=Paenibacillus mangrovi TaxID=2931978 RepID=A0A9X1WRE5_9BACL|nr:glycoside hydrolase domain-containing protein [Paenibacillus mangrovi]MCJ8012268.1 S-layer homology domain-containing protein [Paenibacillus mangrovi]
MFRRTTCIMICFMILASIFIQNYAPRVYADSRELDVWVVNAMKAVYRTSTIPANPVNSIDLVSAKNEYESEQIAVRSNRDFEITGIEFSDLASSVNTISNRNLSYHFEEYVLEDTVQPNQYRPDLVGTQIYPLSEIPDPLSSDPSIHVAANSTQPIFITNYVPADAAPGLYHGMVTVKSTLGDYQVPINVEVANVEVPQTSKANFVNYQWAMTNGFMIGGSPQEIADDPLTQSSYDVGQNYYGVETYSDKWFELMDHFAKTMSDYRQNMIWVRTDLLLNAKGTKMVSFKDGIPKDIDWSLFDRYVETFMKRGITHFANIHLIHALEQMPQSERPNNDDPADPWKTSIPEPGSLPVTDAYLTNYLTALHDHLEDKGWLNDNGFTWYQHTKDEPNGASITNYMTYIARQLKEIVPDFKTLDADAAGTLMNEAIKPYVDVWVPLTPVFQDKKNLYKAEQAAGKDLWVYTCDANPAPWLNRFWTQPILTGRLLFWNLSQDDVQGHLHWGWNVWYVPHYGDSTIVYPDKEHMTVKSSLRYEAQRDGLEDYELMYQLKQTNPKLAKRIADSAVSPSDPRKYTLDPEYIRMLHNYLVKAAAGESMDGIPIPVPISPYDGQDVPMTYMTDNTSSEITYNGEWFAKSRKYAYMGGVQATLKAEDNLTYTFKGSGIDLIAEKNEGSGKVAVYVDDSDPVIIDLYEKVQLDSISVYSNHNLSSAGKHTIKVVNLENKSLYVDGFRVSMYEGQKIYDGTLQSLELTNAPSFHFNKSKINYQVVIPKDVNVISITPTLADTNGTLDVNGKSTNSGKRLTFNIPTGKSEIHIRSTASDGETTSLYTLNFLKGNVNEPGTNMARSYSDITASAAREGDGGIYYGASKMVDGSYGTMFASKSGYTDTHPFPHEINLTWDQQQTFNTIVMATPSGLLQGISDIDVQVTSDGTNWKTIAKRVPIGWNSSTDDNIMEYTYANIPTVKDALKLRIRVNDANYTYWGIYALYELELYNLPDNGEISPIADGTLRNLTIPDVPAFKFNNSTTTYPVMVPNDVNTIAITPMLSDEEGTLQFNGKNVPNNTAQTIDIPIGKSEVHIKSTASDGTTTMLYTLNILKGNVNEPGTNMARSYSDITATAAREGEDYSPQKMVDGSYGTMFASLRGYNNSHPFPHEINLTWDQQQTFNTIVMATTSGLIQGISNIDVQASTDGVNFETIAKEVPLQWNSSIDDNVMEYTFANIPTIKDALKLRIQINDANYTTWGMYAVYELELYNLPENGEIGAIHTHTITAGAGENGTISPNGAVVVNDGADQTFKFNPNNGYEIDKVRLDGTDVTVTGSVYTVANITADHMIHVTFKRKDTGGGNSNPPTSGGNSSIPSTGSGTANGNTDTHTLIVKKEDLTALASNGVVTIVAKDKEKIVLPSNAAELLGHNQFVIQTSLFTWEVPAELLKLLTDKLPAIDKQNSTIELIMTPLSEPDAKKLQATGQSSTHAQIKLSGNVIHFSLSIVGKDGKVTSLSSFDKPMTIRFKADPSLNSKLTGIYDLADNNELEYVGGTFINGEWVAKIHHFGKYALLEFKKIFTDVKSTHWAADAIEQLAAKQFIDGTSAAMFEPERSITRAEFTAMLVKALSLTSVGESKFTDVSKGAWYEEAVSIAVKAGIIKGTSTTTFDPDARIKREEMVTMMMRAYVILKDVKLNGNTASSFTDESSVAAWALDSVRAAASLHLINGRDANKFVPSGITSRAEAAALLNRVLQ